MLILASNIIRFVLLKTVNKEDENLIEIIFCILMIVGCITFGERYRIRGMFPEEFTTFFNAAISSELTYAKGKTWIIFKFPLLNFAIFRWLIFVFSLDFGRFDKWKTCQDLLTVWWFITKWCVPVCMTASATVYPHLPVSTLYQYSNNFIVFLGEGFYHGRE